MIAIFVNIRIKDGFREQFTEASLGDAQGSVRDEPGCFRFDVLESPDDPNLFHLYEVYADDAAFKAHGEAPHFKKWYATCQPMFDGDLEITRMSTVFPSEDGWNKQKPALLSW